MLCNPDENPVIRGEKAHVMFDLLSGYYVVVFT